MYFNHINNSLETTTKKLLASGLVVLAVWRPNIVQKERGGECFGMGRKQGV